MVTVLIHDSFSVRDEEGCIHRRGLFRSNLLAAKHVGEILAGDHDCADCSEGITTHVLGSCCQVRHMEVMTR